MKYLIPLFLLGCWITPSHAGTQIMKCVNTDGHVTYTRSCSHGDDSSQIQMDAYGNTIHTTDTDRSAGSNEKTQESNKSSPIINAGNSSVTGMASSTDEASSSYGSDADKSGGGSISGSAEEGSNGHNDGDAAGSGTETAAGTNNSITETSNTDADSRTATTGSGNTESVDTNPNPYSTDTANPTITTAGTKMDDKGNGDLDSDNTTTEDINDIDNNTSSTSESDKTESVDTASDDTSTGTDVEITLIDISESPSDKYNHTVSSVRIDRDKGEITIKGSEFGSGPDVMLYDRFENGVTDQVIPLKNSGNLSCWNNTSDLDIRDKQGPLNGCWSEYGTNKPRYSDIAYSGDHSMQVHNNSEGMLQIKKNLDNFTRAFITYWVHVPQTENSYFPGTYWYREDGTVGGIEDAKHEEFPKDSSWKMNWLLQDGKHDGLNANLVLPSHIGSGFFSLGGNDNKLVNLGSADNWWSWKHWNRISVWIQADPDDPLSTGEVLFQVMSQDMGFYQSSGSVPIFDNDGPTEKYFNSINFPGWIRAGSITKPLYDDIYIATGPNAVSRVEIGDSDTYQLSTRVEILQISSWSNNEITLLFDNEKGLNLEGKRGYLYITDNQGRVNKSGYPLHK